METYIAVGKYLYFEISTKDDAYEIVETIRTNAEITEPLAALVMDEEIIDVTIRTDKLDLDKDDFGVYLFVGMYVAEEDSFSEDYSLDMISNNELREEFERKCSQILDVLEKECLDKISYDKKNFYKSDKTMLTVGHV